jgi:hypothetical protein
MITFNSNVSPPISSVTNPNNLKNKDKIDYDDNKNLKSF